MGYANQAQHKPSARANTNIKILKNYTYAALHQRTIKTEIITGGCDTPYGTNTRKTNFPTQSTLDGIVVFFTSALITGVQLNLDTSPIWTFVIF
jgi:hypothetical protein